MKTTNCNIYKEKCEVYCGRGKGGSIPSEPNLYGWLGNPIKIGSPCSICSLTHKKSGETLVCYKKYLLNKLQDKNWKNAFIKIKGKKLGCFCKPKPCHTDVMIEVLENNF